MVQSALTKTHPHYTSSTESPPHSYKTTTATATNRFFIHSIAISAVFFSDQILQQVFSGLGINLGLKSHANTVNIEQPLLPN